MSQKDENKPPPPSHFLADSFFDRSVLGPAPRAVAIALESNFVQLRIIFPSSTSCIGDNSNK